MHVETILTDRGRPEVSFSETKVKRQEDRQMWRNYDEKRILNMFLSTDFDPFGKEVEGIC